MKRREDLTTPRRGSSFAVRYDPEAFGRFSESIARTLGTARFLMFQTVVCIIWLTWNIALPSRLRFDPNPFGVLTLALSLQAAYAAPLILLATNRQEHRDRTQNMIDRRVAERTQVDTEFLARELASVRRALGDVATSTELDDQLSRVTNALEQLTARLDALDPATTA